MKTPRFLQVYKMPPREDEVRQVITDHVIGKLEPSPHLYGDKPEVHLVPIQIPISMLLS